MTYTTYKRWPASTRRRPAFGVTSSLHRFCPKAHLSSLYTRVYRPKVVVQVGNSLYWILVGNLVGIIKLDLVKQSIVVIPAPVDVFTEGKHGCVYGRKT